MITTAFIHQDLRYFFSQSQAIDIEIGQKQAFSLSKALDLLQQTNITKRQRTIDILCASLWVLGYVFQGCDRYSFIINQKNTKNFLDHDGLKISLLSLQNYIKQLGQSSVGISQQMALKSLFNLFYVSLYYSFISCKQDSVLFQQLRQTLKNLQIDAFLIKLVTLSLDVHYLPIKKLSMLYTRVLSIQFSLLNLYDDQDLYKIANQNLLPEDYLKEYKQKHNPKDVIRSKDPILQFYAKHNVGECPLAQSIVVGLLRSLLTICNAQTHKKISFNSSNSGADAYRQWQVTYQFLQRYPSFLKNLSQVSKQQLANYNQYNETTNTAICTQFQFYSHKIYTASAIAVFFSFLLNSFKKSIFIHFTYLYQLISEANGILVFLKFLTDKFDNFQVPKQYHMKDNTLNFENQVMLTIFSVLLILYGACNNYPQKARNYLFQYNSYLIIKKIPHLFMKNRKNQQLPSKKEIQQQFGQQSQLNPITLKARQLTVLCYDLLKIQIPFFSKKVKESSNNVRMIVQIYCQLPKKVQPIKRTDFDKMLLKNKMKKNQTEKYIRSIQELKTIHHQYNNYYYWANDQLSDLKKQAVKQNPDPQLNMNKEQLEKWLEENVWRYFD